MHWKGNLRPRPWGVLMGILFLLFLSPSAQIHYASIPLCAMEIWTDKSEYRTDERIELFMWLKVNDNPNLPEIQDARLELELRPSAGTFITVQTREDISLEKGVEWTQSLLLLPTIAEPFRNLGEYEARAMLLSPSDVVYCEALSRFTIRTIFGRTANSRTLIVASRRTDLTEPFVSRLANWLGAAYRTRVQVIYQEGLLQSYQTGLYRAFDVIIYYGTDYEQTPPRAFIEDITQGEGITEKKVIWIGYHIEKIPSYLSLFGLRFGAFSSSNAPTSLLYLNSGGRYNLLNQDRLTVQVTNDQLAKVWATMDGAPIIVSARRQDQQEDGDSFYFVGFHPTSFLTPFGAHLVFLDALSEVYGIHREKFALLRLEDIDAFEDREKLLEITNFLKEQKVPFTLALIPIFRNGQGQEVRLSRDRDFRMMVKNALLDGGEIVLHGASHQFDGLTGVDFEFWDERTDSPIGGRDYAMQRVAEALMETEFSGLHASVVGWETPHYKASPDHYAVFEEFFELIYEDPRWEFDLKMVPHPTITEHNIYVPTNLMNVREGSQEIDVDRIIQQAGLLTGLQNGALASLFYHPGLGIERLKQLVLALKQQGWKFVPASSLLNEQ